MPPIKRRYLLFKMDPVGLTSKEKFVVHEGEIVNAVRDAVHRLHGDFGLGSILLNFHSKKFDLTTRTGVLVAKRESYRFLLTTLPLMKSIRQDQPVSISVLKVTGTLRGCLRALQGYHGKMIHQYRKRLKKDGTGPDRASSPEMMITKGIESIVDSLRG